MKFRKLLDFAALILMTANENAPFQCGHLLFEDLTLYMANGTKSPQI